MTSRIHGDLQFVRATAADVADVLAVLDHAAAWLTAAGIQQWPDRFVTEWITPAVERGETWLVRANGRTAGTVTLDWSDPVWSDCLGRAGYLHRMAVERWAVGTGSAILTWAADRARAHDAAGFHHRGDVEVGGAPGQRSGGGTRTLVSRYELLL
ncbi:hypothetical protein FHG89_08465 [Micromonospora orduensis]|uniref:GNAT family N-acetyltransferase n=1 Tax=Micromonospora orduensis TaxID=1420891 RepID=A0A5C4QW47_9ACTN|nr:hypothetical protein [Micromonospora orduensis]TNH30276.1 hypothetical protein FHG89_08465 [Micromonospora orduensis]